LNRSHVPTTSAAGTTRQHLKPTEYTQQDIWSEERVAVAKKIVERQNTQQQLSKFWQDKLESNAALHWDKFYNNNGVNFFKV
jgi:hypothetical protein